MQETEIDYGSLKPRDDHIKRPKHARPSITEDEYETPFDDYYPIIDYVKLLGESAPDFDPFAKVDRGDGKTNSKCADYLTKKDNAFGVDWVIKTNYKVIIPKTVWVNHPHTEHELTLMTITNQYKKFGFCVVLFIPANTAGTEYWDRYIEPYRIGGNPKYKNIRPKKIIAFPYQKSIRFLLNGKPATDKQGKPEFSRNRYFVVVWKSRKINKHQLIQSI